MARACASAVTLAIKDWRSSKALVIWEVIFLWKVQMMDQLLLTSRISGDDKMSIFLRNSESIEYYLAFLIVPGF